jgi:hypothetical protein
MMYIRVGDYSIIFEDTIVDENLDIIDISSATHIYYKFEKPDGTEVLCTGSFSTGGGVDGVVKYVVASTLFDVAGVWQYQINVITPTRNWNSCITSFFVEDII